MRVAAALLAAVSLGPALAIAQSSFSISALSDFRMRGLSYSEEKPVLQLAANHDFANGFYLGAFASQAKAAPSRLRAIGSLYAGIARGGPDFYWDAGVVRKLYGATRQYSYHEWYAGVGMERLSARLSYSPAYQGIGGRIAYAEVSGGYPLSERLDLSAHLGYLHGLKNSAYGYAHAVDRPDWRIGLHAVEGDWSFQLAWSGTRRGAGIFPSWKNSATRGLVLGATRHF